MAENIYSKGTRVWFEDKDQAWISAEVSSFTKAPDDSIKLVFIDERGKVEYFLPVLLLVLAEFSPGNLPQHLGPGDQGWKARPSTLA